MTEVSLAEPVTPRVQTLIYRLGQGCLLLSVFFLPISVFFLNVFLALTSICVVLSGSLRAKLEIVARNPVIVALIFFYCWFLLFSFSSPVGSAEAANVLHKYGKLVYVPFLVPLLIEEKWRKRALAAFVLSMLVTLFFVALNLSGIVQIGAEVAAPFKNRIETSMLYAFAFYFCAYHAHEHGKFSWRHLVAASLFAAALLLVNTGRTGYVVFSVVCIVWCFQKYRLRGVISAAATLFIAIVILMTFSTSFNGRIQQGISAFHKFRHHPENISLYTRHGITGKSVGDKGKIQQQIKYMMKNPSYSRGRSFLLRIQFLQNSWALLQGHLLFGRGVGSFRTLYYEHYGPHEVINGKEKILQDPHNEYMMILFQLGFAGLVLWLSVLAIQFFMATHSPLPWRHYGQAFVLAYGVSCLCDAMLFLSCPGHFFVIFTAILFASSYRRLAHAASTSH